MVVEVQPTNFERLGEEPNIETVASADARLHRARLQPLPGELLPGRRVQPGGPGPRRAPGDRLRDRPRADQRDRRPRHLVRRPRDPARVLQVVLRASPSRTTRCDPDMAQPDARRRRLGDGRRRGAREGRRAASSSTSTCARSRRTTSRRRSWSPRRRSEIGVKFNVQVVSVDKLTDLTVRKVDGKPAPDFDTFIWGWGGDPYDPSFLLSLFLTERDRRPLRLVLLEPRVRPALQRAGRRPSTSRSARRSSSRWSRSPSATCPTSSSPTTRTCRPTGPTRSRTSSRSCPADETGDIICEQVGYEPLLTLDARGGRRRLGRGRRPVAGPGGRRRDRLRARRLAARARARAAAASASRWSLPE